MIHYAQKTTIQSIYEVMKLELLFICRCNIQHNINECQTIYPVEIIKTLYSNFDRMSD